MAEYIEKDVVIEGLVLMEDLAGADLIESIPAANVRENVIRTQGDKLRAMSDEELAEWLQSLKYSPSCDSRCHDDFEKYGEQRTYCADCWLDWLKSKAEVE